MKKRYKILLGVGIATIILIVIISLTQISKTSKLKELLEAVQCKYYKTTSSSENGYKNDIYIGLPYNPTTDGDNGTNQYYYERMIQHVANAIDAGNYRLIDEERNIIIRLKFDGESVTYTINGDNNYYETAKAKNQNQDEKITKAQVSSNILTTIIENNWSMANSKSELGTIDSKCDDYDYYFDEGYRIKTKQTQVYNIIFTKNYTEDVLKNIKVGTDTNQIKETLGEPTFTNKDGNEIIGYKTEDFYIIFSTDEISIYKTEQFDQEKNEKFANIVTEFLNTEDYDKFVNELIEIYPDYVTYQNKENGVKIEYPQRGLKIEFEQGKTKGITIYSNYVGKITNEVSTDDVKNGEKVPNNINYDEFDYVFTSEIQRIATDYNNRHGKTERRTTKVFNSSNKFNIMTSDYIIYKFYSKDKENSDYSFSERTLTTVFNITDNIFIYGVSGSGVYLYDATTGTKIQWIMDNGKCNINRVENNEVYYDDKKVEYNNNFEITSITTDEKYYSDESMM